MASSSPDVRARENTTTGALLVGQLLGATGCPEPEPEEPLPVELARVDGWVRVTDVEADVFGASRPEDVPCDEVMGYGLESFGPDLAFEVKTDLCDWFTGTQPTAVALAPGDIVSIDVWHYDLVAEMPAQGYVALAIDGAIAWEETVEIPAPGAMLEGEIAIESELPAGTELQFHVHNHGPNSWDLLGIEATLSGGGS